MLNLKPVYDAVQAANAEVRRVASEISAAFELGTDEGNLTALGMREALDNAQAKAKEAQDLYDQMTALSKNAAAAMFVPAGEGEKPTGKKTITRAQYDAMSQPERYQFLMKDGGTVEDTLQE
jgi:hypothetical protein